ncbi:CU044_5270 family protein [Paractinoplanes lichenicola]|uniref:CU044_5270 family protein n=1 Tax=Paractinoplanes lichenicola TaxID=2802976 RepID=A0ABS1VGJ0_9ACTN|nr:CU044_5270 family protein [Actinoplanes lichenicola]MBL7253788.1 CU044_5270 family protein [Actinoplanes lichenicola]
MNDLDLMEKFRADVPPPAPDVLASARAAMFRAEPPRPRTRWVWRLAPAAALAVAVGVAGVLTLPSEPAGQPGQGPAPATASDAVRVLRLAAAEARREPVLKARPDQFVYVESRYAGTGRRAGVGADGETAPSERRRQVWQSVDGTRTGLLREKDGDTPLDAGFPAYRDKLPTDAKAMRAFLYQDAKPNPKGIPVDQIAFTKVSETLREQYLPPAALAALFEAAATIPGTKTVPRTDFAGRRGVAVSRADAFFRQDLIFDEKTYKFLGERSVVVGELPDVKKGAVINFTAQLRIAIVDRAGQLP